MGSSPVLRAVVVGLLLTAVSYLPAVAEETRWGTLTGRFVYDGVPPEPPEAQVVGAVAIPLDESLIVNPKNRGIANIAVFLRVETKELVALPIHPSYEKQAEDVVEIAIVGRRFEPRFQLLRKGQTLRVTNKDPEVQNVNIAFTKNPPVNQNLEVDDPLDPNDVPGVEQKCTRSERLPVQMKSDIYPWVSGRVLVADTPYMAWTDANGNFEIKNLPVGEHTFQLWHEELGYVQEIRFGPVENVTEVEKGRLKVTIKEGENDLGRLWLSPKLFEKE